MQQPNENDIQMLKKILGMLSKEALDEIMFLANPNTYWYEWIVELRQPVSDGTPADKTLRERWRSSVSKNSRKSRFILLMEKYINAYLRREKDAPSRTEMENIVSNHSKWNRMMNQYGRGKQYEDDIRRVCFLFHLTFPEANELMWSAGQMFDIGEFRDFILVDCLNRKIYSPELVDQILKQEGLPPLFPED